MKQAEMREHIITALLTSLGEEWRREDGKLIGPDVTLTTALRYGRFEIFPIFQAKVTQEETFESFYHAPPVGGAIMLTRNVEANTTEAIRMVGTVVRQVREYQVALIGRREAMVRDQLQLDRLAAILGEPAPNLAANRALDVEIEHAHEDADGDVTWRLRAEWLRNARGGVNPMVKLTAWVYDVEASIRLAEVMMETLEEEACEGTERSSDSTRWPVSSPM